MFEFLVVMNKDKHNKLKIEFPPYYKEISKRLMSYFDNVENLEKYAQEKSDSEGVFLKKANKIIKRNLENHNFKVDDFARKMALSRTQLFRRIKSLTKMSPSAYILFFRLQVAKELLQSNENDLNVTEVSYKVGFISRSHFNRSFQKQFGFNPSGCR